MENKYLKEEEIKELIKKAQQGDINARNKIVESNIQYVKYEVNKINNIRKDEADDLLQVGCLGLIDAIYKFDLNRKTKFLTFASFDIRRKIYEFILLGNKTIRIPYNQAYRIYQLDKYEEEFYKTNGRKPTFEELIEQYDLTERKLKYAYSNKFEINSLSYCDTDDEHFIGEKNPEENYINKDEIYRIILAKELLKEKEQNIINLYFYENKNIPEIAKEYNITKQRVQQILTKALEEIKEKSELRTLETLNNNVRKRKNK